MLKKVLILQCFLLPGFLPAKSLSLFNNPFQYSAEYTDSEDGDQYLIAREYSPELNRFIERDSYDLMNRYAYADGNPVMNEDPSGHCSEGTCVLCSLVKAVKSAKEDNLEIEVIQDAVAQAFNSGATGANVDAIEMQSKNKVSFIGNNSKEEMAIQEVDSASKAEKQESNEKRRIIDKVISKDTNFLGNKRVYRKTQFSTNPQSRFSFRKKDAFESIGKIKGGLEKSTSLVKRLIDEEAGVHDVDLPEGNTLKVQRLDRKGKQVDFVNNQGTYYLQQLHGSWIITYVKGPYPPGLLPAD